MAETPPKPVMTPATLLLASGTIITWSSAFPAISFGLEHFTAGQLAFLRFLIASACFALLVPLKVIRVPPLRMLPKIALLGVVGIAAYQLLLGFAMNKVQAGAASVLIALSPVVTSLLATWRLGEPLTRRMLLGLAVAFAGAVSVSLGGGSGIGFEPLALLIFVSVICTSAYFVFQKPLLREINSLDFTAFSIMFGTLALLPFAGGATERLMTASSAQLLSLLWLGLAPSFIGYLLWNLALSRAPAGPVSMLLYIQPLLSSAIAWVWLGQVPTILTVIGGVILIIGVMLGNSRPRPARA